MSCRDGRENNFEKSMILKYRHDANTRERIRTHSVNTAFNVLRALIPTEPADRKLSKIEILRLACSYISHLTSLVVSGACDNSTHELKQTRRVKICTFCAPTKKYTQPENRGCSRRNHKWIN